jgi:predicted TIM-barrel fold metal-dependent hydrolase
MESKEDFYNAGDFAKVPKVDMHFHYNTCDAGFLQYADSLNFRLVSVNVDAGRPIDGQFENASTLKRAYPDLFAFFGTFPVDNFESKGFGNATILQIGKCMKAGASGMKIWKNIGMSQLDKSGKFVMADHVAFDPIYSFLEEQQFPLIAHLGEPKNCWLPADQMTTPNDKRYFVSHPEYHMYLHPEAPSYEDQISARNHLLQKHPRLDFIGAHLASEEWSTEVLSKSLDRYPALKVDLAARMSHLQYQSSIDRQGVRDFMVKYQDRILYGTDMSVDEKSTKYSSVCEGMKKTWLNHWIYLATDSIMAFKDFPDKKLKGLQLPREVIDKVFSKNAEIYFKKQAQ